MHRTAAPLLLGCLSALIALLCASRSIRLSPPVLLVPYGGSLPFSCATTCADPNVSGGVETSSVYTTHLNVSGAVETSALYTLHPRGARMEVELHNVTEWNSTVQCFFRCYGARDGLKADLIAYRPLDQPELQPLPPLRSGRAYNVSCVVPNVSPIRNLSLSLFRGDIAVHSATFQDYQHYHPTNASLTFALTARRKDRGQSVACRAVLDMRPYGPLLTANSTAHVLDVYDFPSPPTLTSSPPRLHPTAAVYLELGEGLNVTCSARNAFPTAAISLLLDGETLQPHSTDRGSVGAVGLLWDRPGKHTVLCRARVGPEEQSEELVVRVYEFPAPQLNVSSASPVATQNVSGLCALPGGREGGIELRVTVGRSVVVEPWGPSPLHFTLLVTEEHDGSELRCEAKAEGGARKHSGAVRLNVSALPHMDDELCPPAHSWTEGQEVRQWCRARGKPSPVVLCYKDGAAIAVQQPHVVSRNHSGTYRCDAVNALGVTSRMVSVSVQYWDVNVGLWVSLAVLTAALAAGGGAAYRLYYCKKKVRQYELQKEQQRLMAMGKLPGGGADTAPNGSAPGAQP